MSIAIVLLIVLVALVLFSLESIPLEVSSLTIVVLLAISGVLTPQEAFAGFSNDTVIFIFTLLVMTQGLVATGVVQLVGQRLSFFSRFGPRTFILALMAVVVLVSLAISNAVTTAAFLPIAIGAAERAKIPRSKVLLPMAYASMVGGMIMIYGTSTNLVASEAMTHLGLAPIGIWELAPVGIPIAIIGVLMVVGLGPLLLPVRENHTESSGFALRDYLTEVVLTPNSRYAGRPLSEVVQGLGLRVLGVMRGAESLPVRPDHVIDLQDRLLLEAKREDLLRVKDLQGLEIRPDLRLGGEAVGEGAVLVEASVPPGSTLVGRSLKEALMAERYGVVALALHRHPSVQRLTKLQLLGRVFGGASSLASVALSAGDVLLVRGSREKLQALSQGETLSVLGDVEYQPPLYAKAFWALAVFLGTLTAGASGLIPLSVAGLIGMLTMIFTGCVESRRAFRVDWRVVMLIGSMLALGLAMEKSGAGLFLGQRLVSLVGTDSPRVALLLLMTLTIVLSAPMSNQAAALVMLPVAVHVANQLGIDPRAFAIGVTVAASCSFVTPLEPSCVMVYGPGNYRFSDFVRLGTPLTLVLVAFLLWALPLAWPFQKATAAAQPAATRVQAH